LQEHLLLSVLDAVSIIESINMDPLEGPVWGQQLAVVEPSSSLD